MAKNIIQKLKNNKNLLLWVSGRNGTIDDISGNNNTTAFSPTGASIQKSDRGPAMYFDGTGSVACGQVYTTFTPFTVCAWAKPMADRAGDSSGNSGIINKCIGAARAFWLDYGFTTDSFGFFASSVGSLNIVITTGMPIGTAPPGKWYHIAATVDTTNDVCYTYVNGIPLGSDTDLGDIATNPTGMTGVVAIGTEQSIPSRLFKGFINDAMIINRVLTNTEIFELMAETSKAVQTKTKTVCKKMGSKMS